MLFFIPSILYLYLYYILIYSPALYILNDSNSEKVFNQILIEWTFAYIHISSFKDVLLTNLEQYIKSLKVLLLWGVGHKSAGKVLAIQKRGLEFVCSAPTPTRHVDWWWATAIPAWGVQESRPTRLRGHTLWVGEFQVQWETMWEKNDRGRHWTLNLPRLSHGQGTYAQMHTWGTRMSHS